MRVIILSGLPGSGKCHWVENYWSGKFDKESICIVCADNFFLNDDGKYCYNAKTIGEAHNWCLRLFLQSLSSSVYQTVIVDNTNITPVEIAPYHRIASALGHSVDIVRIWIDPLRAFSRNRHDVPLGTIMAMHARMLHEPLPSFWKVDHVLAEGPGS